MLVEFTAVQKSPGSRSYTGFEGLYYTGTKDYIDRVLQNANEIESCQTAGNGITEGEEECDDGNLISGDGYSASMQFELNTCDPANFFESSPPLIGCIGGGRAIVEDRGVLH